MADTSVYNGEFDGHFRHMSISSKMQRNHSTYSKDFSSRVAGSMAVK